MSETIPKALFDTLQHLDSDMPPCVEAMITNLPIAGLRQEYELSRLFLASYAGSVDTFNAYRKEVERFIQWCWLVAKKPVQGVDRHDIREYLLFADAPPKNWIALKSCARFVYQDGLRVHNKDWRPFVAKITKSQSRQGQDVNLQHFQLSNNARAAMMAGLSTYFTFLQQEQYVEVNPVQLVRQKSRFIQRQQSIKVTRRLSGTQWQHTINAIQDLADKDSRFERHLFILSAFYLLGLRISELAETPGRIPMMGDFAPDKHDRWWFTTVGKGNKLRDIAVPDAMLTALKRYRQQRGLTPLPGRAENTPLIHKERGRGGPTTRQIRNLVQQCFDIAIDHLQRAQQADAASDLTSATVHWLRHTAISADVEHRPREHVRDDAGHENANITDRYIDADRTARHQSAKSKTLLPDK